MSRFVSDYSTQSSRVIRIGISVDQILFQIRFVDKDIVGWQNRIAFPKRVASDVEAHHRIQPMTVGEKNRGLNFSRVDSRSSEPYFDLIENSIKASIERFSGIHLKGFIRGLVSKKDLRKTKQQQVSHDHSEHQVAKHFVCAARAFSNSVLSIGCKNGG